MPSHSQVDDSLALTGSSEMHGRIQALDWSKTPVGPVGTWPVSLKSLIRALLASQYPMLLSWGPHYTQFYNDAYSKLIGEKHPVALGTDLRATLAEAWNTLGPMIEKVLATGVANWTPALLLSLERFGYREEAYFSVSHSPAEDDEGRIMGMLAVCSEVTEQVLSERRVRLLRDLAAQGNDLPADEGGGSDAICTRLADAVSGRPLDVPFALFYQCSDHRLTLCASAGWDPPGAEVIILDEASSGESNAEQEEESVLDTLKRLVGRAAQGESGEWHGFDQDFTIPGGPWGEPVRAARVLPIAVAGQNPLGVLVAGISPNRALDENYLSFYDLLVRQVAVALRNAQAYEAERQRAEALAQLDRAKTEFFNNVSHEFRTPLTLMLGPLEALQARAEAGLAPPDSEDLALVHRNSLRLLKLVNTLLSFSRLETQRVEAWFAPTDLAAYTVELASAFASATERAGLRLITHCPPLPEPVYVDREMWEKVVLNLLSNAFKFTFEGEIRVEMQWTGEGVELSVSDTGTGIPAAELPHLFERFHRVRGARSRSHEGSGIGLALVQELVRLHGGEVRVESEIGRGTRFTVFVPQGTAHLPSDQVEWAPPPTAHAVTQVQPLPIANETALPLAQVYRDEVIQWISDSTNSFDMGITNAEADLDTPGATETAPGAARARILLVDDNADMCAYLSRLMRDYEVETARNGRAALEAAQARQPDLIITDVMMPEVDGFELVRQIRTDARLKDVPIMVLSARAGEAARIEGLEHGADDYLVKPFRARELLAKVEANLRTYLAQREATDRRLSAILERITDAFYAIDKEWRFIYINAQCQQYLGRDRTELLGKVVWEALPNIRDTEFFRQYHHAMQTQEAVHVEAYSPQVGRWLSASAYPSSEGLSVYFRDISARREAEIERERLLREAQEANRIKDEFLAIVSHELRTPLNAIMGWANLMNSGALSEEEMRRGLESIERNAKTQAQIVEDILDVSRIVTGKMALMPTPTHMDATLRAVLDTVRPMAKTKLITLHDSIEDQVGLVWGDSARLQQIFWNLLSNAIKFTPQGGTVTASLRREGETAVVEVRDSGVGIKAEFLPHVFDRFRQADMSSTRIHGGLGLGLAIVRQLVDLHQGHIRAESAGLGQGATFIVELPILHHQHNAEHPSHPIALDHVVPADASPPERPRPLKNLRILVVDDQDDNRQLLALMLTRFGATVQEVDSASNALSVWDEFAPQILLSDLGMPGYDGYWLLSQIRARESLQHSAHVPAIALTAYTQNSDRSRALQAGFERHLAKPTNATELIATIRELVQSVSQK